LIIREPYQRLDPIDRTVVPGRGGY
jgi:hypothetical protein